VNGSQKIERLAIVVLAVVLEPEAFGLPDAWSPPALAYMLLLVVAVGTVVDRRRMARALRAAAAAVEDES
jgi:hypothetical protein